MSTKERCLNFYNFLCNVYDNESKYCDKHVKKLYSSLEALDVVRRIKEEFEKEVLEYVSKESE